MLWAVALLLVSIAMRLSFLKETFSLNQWVFRLWYVSGAMLVPAYLGTGMIYLMAPSKVANYFLGFLLLATLVALVVVLTASIKTPDECLTGLEALECLLPSQTLTMTGFSPSWIRILAAILKVYGGLALVAGAVWSAGFLVREDKGRKGGVVIQPAEAEGASGAGRKITGVLAGSARDPILATKLLWQYRDFWRHDIPVQRIAITCATLRSQAD